MATLKYEISESAQYLIEQTLHGSRNRLRGEELTSLLRQTFPDANEASIEAGLDLYLKQNLAEFKIRHGFKN